MVTRKVTEKNPKKRGGEKRMRKIFLIAGFLFLGLALSFQNAYATNPEWWSGEGIWEIITESYDDYGNLLSVHTEFGGVTRDGGTISGYSDVTYQVYAGLSKIVRQTIHTVINEGGESGTTTTSDITITYQRDACGRLVGGSYDETQVTVNHETGHTTTRTLHSTEVEVRDGQLLFTHLEGSITETDKDGKVIREGTVSIERSGWVYVGGRWEWTIQVEHTFIHGMDKTGTGEGQLRRYVPNGKPGEGPLSKDAKDLGDGYWEDWVEWSEETITTTRQFNEHGTLIGISGSGSGRGVAFNNETGEYMYYEETITVVYTDPLTHNGHATVKKIIRNRLWTYLPEPPSQADPEPTVIGTLLGLEVIDGQTFAKVKADLVGMHNGEGLVDAEGAIIYILLTDEEMIALLKGKEGEKVAFMGDVSSSINGYFAMIMRAEPEYGGGIRIGAESVDALIKDIELGNAKWYNAFTEKMRPIYETGRQQGVNVSIWQQAWEWLLKFFGLIF